MVYIYMYKPLYNKKKDKPDPGNFQCIIVVFLLICL